MQAGVFVCMLISRILRFISEILLLFRLWLLPYRSSPCRSDGNYRRCIPRVYPAGISPHRPRDGCFYLPRQAHGCNYQKSVGAAARCPRHRVCNQPLWQNYRQVGLCLAYALIACVMRLFEMLESRRIVVIVIDKHAHIKPRNIIYHGVLASCRAGEPEADKIAIEHSRHHGGICTACKRCAHTVYYGRTVENDGLLVFIIIGREDFRALAQSDIKPVCLCKRGR